MKVTAESTSRIVTLVVDGADVPARVWEATTERGVKCHLYVTRVQVDRSLDCGEFERELREQRPPSPEVQAFPLRMIL